MSLYDSTFVVDHRICIVSTETLVWWRDSFAYAFAVY